MAQILIFCDSVYLRTFILSKYIDWDNRQLKQICISCFFKVHLKTILSIIIMFFLVWFETFGKDKLFWWWRPNTVKSTNACNFILSYSRNNKKCISWSQGKLLPNYFQFRKRKMIHANVVLFYIFFNLCKLRQPRYSSIVNQ